MAHGEPVATARGVPRLGLAVVIDSAGAGREVESAADRLSERLETQAAERGSVSEGIARLATAVRDAYAILGPAGDECDGGSDLVAWIMADGHAIVAAVGRGRCYRVRSRSVQRIGPASAVAGLVWSGQSSAVIETCAIACEPGDTFVLCSAALWACVAPAEIAAAVGRAEDAEEACKQLIGVAWAGGGLGSLVVAVARLEPDVLRLQRPDQVLEPHPLGLADSPQCAQLAAHASVSR